MQSNIMMVIIIISDNLDIDVFLFFFYIYESISGSHLATRWMISEIYVKWKILNHPEIFKESLSIIINFIISATTTTTTKEKILTKCHHQHHLFEKSKNPFTHTQVPVHRLVPIMNPWKFWLNSNSHTMKSIIKSQMIW